MHPTVSDLVILFTRYPTPGQCKTRLIPALGAEGAAALHRDMTHRILGQVTRLATGHPLHLEIHFDGGNEEQMQSWLGADFHYQQQTSGDIGCRMRAAIHNHQGRMRRLLLIGSDCPELTAEILLEAFTVLPTHDLVLGPAFDGGYYLIGTHGEAASTVCATLFHDMEWGTNTVYPTTKARAEHHHLRCHTLARLHDIDTPADLRHLHHYSHPQ